MSVLEGAEYDGQVFLYRRVGEHSVGFIQYQELDVGQVFLQLELVVLNLLDESTWSRHYNVGNVGKLGRLLHQIDPTSDYSGAQVEILPTEDLELLVYLLSKFSRRCEDEGEYPVRVLCQLLQDW